MSSQRLALIHTGGTIASKLTPQGVAPQGAPELTGSEFAGVEAQTHTPFSLPGPHITPQHMLKLRDLIEELTPQVQGIVLTHGTDTLEETAFFLHLTLPARAAVVLTGSMRHSEEPSWDGPGNVRDAAAVALHPDTQGRGALAVFGGDIFDARTVTKVHTTALDAFGGYPGPIGRVDHAPRTLVRYFARPEPAPIFPLREITAKVEILYAYAGWQGEGFAEAAGRADGLVIAALGTGNLPPALESLVQKCTVPVVLATRTHAGSVLPVYGYQGGGAGLSKAGAIGASYLNAHKARILLLVLLSLGAGRERIRAVFEEGLF